MGMFAALLVVSLIYVAAVFVTTGVLSPEKLHDPASGFVNLTPLSTAAGEFLGPAGIVLLSAAAMLAFVTTANSGILTASRSPMAMSHDGLLPGFFQKLSQRFHTPYVSILLTAAFMITVIAVLKIEDLVKVASTMMLVLFLLTNLAVIFMRGSRIQNYRPLYRSWGYPWMQIAGIAIYLLLIVEMSRQMHWIPLLTTCAFALGGILWYLIYVRPRTDRESAFVYMVKNILSKEMYRSNLEDELREIALERDEVIHDRFDRLIQNCPILDLPSAAPAEKMFRKAAEMLSERLDIEPDKLFERFEAREAESSTVIQPGLAIPHIVVEGKGLFEILLVRCKPGVTFPGQEKPVPVAFVLVGSPDERNYHLRALMAIAHIVQEHRFTERWLAAPRTEHLRDIVLLSERSRDV
jgi:mannitol/fructose-specific phosphotransferase system IIA component (Ntr-type)